MIDEDGFSVTLHILTEDKIERHSKYVESLPQSEDQLDIASTHADVPTTRPYTDLRRHQIA